MVIKALIDRTVERYQERTPERQASEEKLRTGSPITADTPVRVQKRLSRLAMSEATRAVVPSPSATSFAATAQANVLERIIGGSDLMSVIFLEAAVATARTVARIRMRSGTMTVGYGTGSLVAPRVLMTNNHVLASAGGARLSLAEFDYQDGIAAPTVFELDPDSLFVTDPTLDYTLVAVRERGTGQADIACFGFNRVIEQEGKVLVGECLNIIQHPNGELKQVALRENQLKDILPQFLHYQTDTAPGSSGSPVFNDQWELVALHHSGVPRTDSEGRYLTRDGMLWEPSMGEQRIDWIANEGARVSQIVAHLKAQPLSGSAARLRDSVFSAPDPALVAPAAAVLIPTARQEASLAATDAGGGDGSSTWTVPIQITLRVGQPAPSGAARPAEEYGLSPALASLDSRDEPGVGEAGLEPGSPGARREWNSGIDVSTGV